MHKVYIINALSFGQQESLSIEVQGVVIGKGTGEICLTGGLGLVAHETALLARTLVGMRTLDIYNYNYHIHFSYPSITKEGCSWGAGCYIMLSWLCNSLSYKEDIAITGEIDLKGDVKPVRYMNEKALTWANGKCRHLIIPEHNEIEKKENVHKIGNLKDIPTIIHRIS